MQIIKINKDNNHIYENLSRQYECEFAPLTGLAINQDGSYDVSANILEITNAKGYLLYFNDLPAGFMLIENIDDKLFNIMEFYIIPACRKQNLGLQFATEILQKHSGAWQIKQLVSAGYATKFWNKVIYNIIGDDYIQTTEIDNEWGDDTIQRFKIK